MTTEDIVRNFAIAIDDNDLESAAGYLAPTFIFRGWTPKPLDKQGFLSLISSIKEGIPGLILNLHNVLVEDDQTVTGTIQIAGYQSDSFVIPVLGTPPIPQTASSVSLPTENVTFRLAHETITALEVQHVENGGIQGLIRQLGIDLPIIQ
jgi:hypothetical protein